MADKSCSVCKKVKSLEEFPKDPRARDGHASNCKECQAIKRKAWADKQEKKPKKSEVRAAAILAAGEKPCSKCGKIKPLDEYHKDPRAKDGRYPHCAKCHYEMTHAYEQTEHGKAVVSKSRHKAYIERCGKEKGRIRNSKPQAKARRVVYQMSEAGREAQKRKDRKRQESSPEKNKARRVVRGAVASGILPPVNTLLCAQCGNQAEEYHHRSYLEEDFLRVTPLCRRCHAKTYTTVYD